MIDKVRAALLSWFDSGRRDLPWRKTRDPYAIWVAEMMLQQTQVRTVVPYYQRFLARFPTVRKLARASVDEVLEAWAGLGYYGRARNLHAAAREVVDHHRGKLPEDEAALRALPGIGRYTAGAIASIAFGRAAPVLDGNAARVLARLVAHDGTPSLLWPLAADLVPPDRPGDFNQALMELGATVCTPRDPTCLICPLAVLCEARRQGRTGELPRPRRRARPREASAACAIVERGAQWLVAKRPPHGLLGGLWEFPTFDLADGEEPAAVAERALRFDLGVEAVAIERLRPVRHAFSHLRLRVEPVRFEWRGGRLKSGRYPSVRFAGARAIDRLALSALARKVLDRLRGS